MSSIVMNGEKIDVLQKELQRGLKLASKAIAGRSTLPVLSNYLLKSDGQRLWIEANNLEIGIRTSVGCKGEPFAITLPGKTLSDYIGNLSSGLIEIAVDVRTQSAKIKSGGSSSSIKGIDADEFPSFPTITSDPVVFPAAEIASAIRTVVVAAAAEHTNPILQGVNIAIADDVATFAAIDGYRLNVKTVKLPMVVDSPIDITLPARALAELITLVSNDDDTVAMSIAANAGQVLFTVGNTELVTRVIDGKFPDYHRFIPPPSVEQTTLRLNTDELTRAVKRIALFAVNAGNIIKLETSADGLTISANAAEVGDATEQVSALFDGNGEPKRNALNVRYAEEALKAIGAADVAVVLTSDNSPVLMRPIGSEGTALCLIMPMRFAE